MTHCGEKKKKYRKRKKSRKGEALIVEVNDKPSYDVLLRRVGEDPELMEFGENAVKAKRTLKGTLKGSCG